jgi:iron complex outermembrane receptor protein
LSGLKQLFCTKTIKYYYLILIFCTAHLHLHSQTYSITGTITDSLNTPLQYVNISLIGTNFGDASDLIGRYHIKNIPVGNYTIQFSAIGYETYKKVNLSIADKSITLNVVLKEQVIESEEIIVTAGKYEQKKSDLPVSSVIIQGNEILKQNFFSIDYALRYIPGINLTENQISVRGSSGYTMGAGTRVLVTMDGVPIYTGDTGEIIWEQIPMTDIERIEVIKGPGSSLYGTSAIGGVINIISRKPSSKPFTLINTFAGIYDKPVHREWDWSDQIRSYYGIAVSHSNTIGDLGYSLSLKKLHDDSYRKDDFKDRYIGYMKLNYDFSDFSSISLLGNYLHMNRGNFLYWMNSRNALLQSEEDQNKTVESDRLFLSLIYKQKFSDKISIEFKPSFYFTNFEGKGIEITSSKVFLSRNEILMNLSPLKHIKLITGAEFSYANVSSNIFSNPNFYTTSGFFQAEYRGIPKFIATAGLRYDFIKLDTISGNALTPKLGLNYKLSERLILRASFGTGFRAPTPAEVFTTTDIGLGVSVEENLDLEAETSLSFEAGISYTPSQILNFDVALFHTHYNNFIEPAFTTEGDIQFRNLVEAKLQGMEVISEISFLPQELNFSIGYTYLWAWNIREDKFMNYRPRHILYFNVAYHPYPFELAIDFRYWSEVEEIDMEPVEIGLIPDGELRVPVFVTDIRVGYYILSLGYPITLYLNAKNIFNYNYVELIANIRPIRNISLGFNLYL